jgi:hypothetical protein
MSDPPIIVKKMKQFTIAAAILLTFSIGFSYGVDLGSSATIQQNADDFSGPLKDYLRDLDSVGAPRVRIDNVNREVQVIFTAPSSYRQVGVSFAADGYSRVYWFQTLLIPKPLSEVADAKGKLRKGVDPNIDSGIAFYVKRIAPGQNSVDYRLVIDGLWTTDPRNPDWVIGADGIAESRFILPAAALATLRAARNRTPESVDKAARTVPFIFTGEPGLRVTVAGTFNGWDPFMYPMREVSRGLYTLNLPLPPGTWQYVFYVDGESRPDPGNPQKAYAPDGRAASEVTVK